MEYEIGGFSVIDAVSLLIESRYVKSFDCNSDLKGVEFESANHRIPVFHLCILVFFLTILYQKSRDFSNVRLSRRFKTSINEKQSIFQHKISTLKNALKNKKVLENKDLNILKWLFTIINFINTVLLYKLT